MACRLCPDRAARPRRARDLTAGLRCQVELRNLTYACTSPDRAARPRRARDLTVGLHCVTGKDEAFG